MVKVISEFYNSILQIIDFVVGRTSDTLADIMIRALPLLAPLPNAISIYYVVQHDPLNYNTMQALGAAAALECMFFALTEVALKMWDGVQTNRRYIYALYVMVGLFVAYFALVLIMVGLLEVRHGNYAPLAFPFVSVVAAVALGCERWHKRNIQLAAEAAQSETVEHSWTEYEQKLNEVQRQLDAGRTEADKLRQQLHQERTQYNQLRQEFDGFSPESILARLDEAKRQKLSDLLALVSDQRVTAPGDLIRHGMTKADVYALWPVATAAQLVYANGDGAYHVRGKS